MAKKKKKADTFEHFYFAVDDWCHEYWYGINRMPHDITPGQIHEHNSIRIIGRIRHKLRRKIETGELHLMCMDSVAGRLREDSESLGGATVTKRHLCCYVLMPLMPFHSLPSTLGAGKIEGFSVTIRNLKYGEGETDSISLDRHMTDILDCDKVPITVSDTPADFRVIER